MLTHEEIQDLLDTKLEQDADRYVTGRISKETWVHLWGHLNPLSYTTVPVRRMDRRMFRVDGTTSQIAGSTTTLQLAPAGR